jgi:endonuclease-3
MHLSTRWGVSDSATLTLTRRHASKSAHMCVCVCVCVIAHRSRHPSLCVCVRVLQVFRFQTLVSLMLSAQTKDQVTAAAVLNLKRDGPLTVERILSMSEAQIDALICKVGFHQRKAKFIRDTARILRDRYDDDIPPTLEGLVELPGVGPKMAFLALQVAWKQNAGIGVDVHVHRISNRLRWVRNTKTPEETRVQLQAWLPSEYWTEINPLLVGFGQQICLPRNPLCSTCLASDLCPSSSHKPRKSLAQAVAEREAAEHDEA